MAEPAKSCRECCMCSNKYPNFTMHSFPGPAYQDVYVKWLSFIKQKYPCMRMADSDVRKCLKICQMHFTNEDYEVRSEGRKILKRTSIPKQKEDIDKVYKTTPRCERTETSLTCTPKAVKLYSGKSRQCPKSTTAFPQNSISVDTSISEHVEIESQDLEIIYVGLQEIPIENTNSTLSTPTQKHSLPPPRKSAKKVKFIDADSTTLQEQNYSRSKNNIANLPLAMQLPQIDINSPAHCSVAAVAVEESMASKGTECITSHRQRRKNCNADKQQRPSNTIKNNSKNPPLGKIRKSVTSHRLRRKNCNQTKRRRRCQFRKLQKKHVDVLEYCNKKVNVITQKFIDMQLKYQNKNARGRCFTLDEKVLSALWLKLGPRAYRVLRRVWFALPSRRTIMRPLSDFPIGVGINKAVINALRDSVPAMNPLDRICYVTFDQMSLHEGLHYDIERDIIIGFVDNGLDRDVLFAAHAMVFMACGIRTPWKQPFAYYFNGAPMSSYNLCFAIEEAIRELRSVGLTVVATVNHGCSVNAAAINQLKKRTDEDCKRNGEENRNFGFTIDGQEVVPLYDPPHLIKCIRNNLLTKDAVFTINGQKYNASWKDIVELYDKDVTNDGINSLSRLSYQHVHPNEGGKMKVSVAAEVLSSHVGQFLKVMAHYDKMTNKLRAEGTSQFVLFVDKLFDSMNGYYREPRKEKPLYCAVRDSSMHHAFWVQAIEVLQTLQFDGHGGKRVRPPIIGYWIETIRGFRYLWRILHDRYNFEFILPRNINQDGFENFFGSIRSHVVTNTKPTAYSFINSYKALLINNCVSAKSPENNCLEDTCYGTETLTELEEPPKVIHSIVDFELLNNFSHDREDVCSSYDDDVALDDSGKGILGRAYYLKRSTRYYIAGYLSKRMIKMVKHCALCKSELTSTEGNEFTKFIFSRPEGDELRLKIPSDRFFNLFSELYDISKKALPRICHKNNVRTLLIQLINFHVDEQSVNTFTCVDHKIYDTFINMFSTFYIRIWIRNVNRILWNKDTRDINDNIKELALKVARSRMKKDKRITKMKGLASS